jgi:hypothetical protein
MTLFFRHHICPSKPKLKQIPHDFLKILLHLVIPKNVTTTFLIIKSVSFKTSIKKCKFEYDIGCETLLDNIFISSLVSLKLMETFILFKHDQNKLKLIFFIVYSH